MTYTYRGWTITFEYGYFNAIGPDYDASWEGEEDGYVDNGQKVTGRTLDSVEAGIDDWFVQDILARRPKCTRCGRKVETSCIRSPDGSPCLRPQVAA